MSPKELAEYIKVCKKHGVTSFEMNGVKVVLDPHYTPQSARKPKETKEQFTTEEYTDEEILTWSVNGN
jgi:sugar phosphate isomerase/epimerase